MQIREDLSLSMVDMVRPSLGRCARAALECRERPAGCGEPQAWAAGAAPLGPGAPEASHSAPTSCPARRQLVKDLQDALEWLDNHFTCGGVSMAQGPSLMASALRGAHPRPPYIHTPLSRRVRMGCKLYSRHPPSPAPRSFTKEQATTLATTVLSRRLSRLDSRLLRVDKVADPTKKDVKPC